MARTKRTRAFLPAIGAAALFALSAEDARRGFELLNPSSNLIVLLVAAAGALWACYRALAPANRPRGIFLSTAVLSMATALLAGNTLSVYEGAAGLAEDWRGQEERRLHSLAEKLQGSFSTFTERLEEPISAARALAQRNPRSGAPYTPARAFDFLRSLTEGAPRSQNEIGLAIYGPSQQLLAWDGALPKVPHELVQQEIPDGKARWIAIESAGLSHVLALARPWRDSPNLLVAGLPVSSIFDRRVLARAISLPGDEEAIERISFLDYRQPPRSLAELFKREGDLLPAIGTERPSLHAALRAPDQSLLAYATLAGRPPEAARSDLHEEGTRHAALAILAAAALLVGGSLVPRPTGLAWSVRSELVSQGGRIAGIWILRFLFLLFPVPVRAGDMALDNAALFAVSGWWGLFRSPIDFLFTGLAVLASGILLSLTATRLLTAAGPYRRRGALVCLIAVLAIAFTFGVRAQSAATVFVQNSRVDVLTVTPLDPSPARVAMQVGAAFMLTGLVLPMLTLGWGAVWAASRRGDTPSPPPTPTDDTLAWTTLLLIPSAFVSCLIFEAAVQPAATGVLKTFLENTLGTVVRATYTLRRLDLQESLRAVQDYPAVADRIAFAPRGGDPTLAHDLFMATPIAMKGYGASLTVVTNEGELLSRFSRNFPYILDARSLEPEYPEEKHIIEFGSGPRRGINALHAHVVIRRDGEPVGTVTIHMRNDLEDVPPLTAPTPLQEALGETRPAGMLLPWARSIGMAVYNADGVPVISSPREPPPPPPGKERLLQDFGESQWTTREESGSRTYELFFGSGNHLVALGFSEPGLTGRLARMIRLAAQSIAFLLILMAPWAAASAIRLGWRLNPSRLAEALSRTHYRRLLTTFLMASLAPLTLLAVALTEFVAGELEQDTNNRAWSAFQAAERQVEDYGTFEGAEGSVDDSYLYTLSDNVGEKLSLFADGQLVATSDPELYDVGVLPERLDGDVYRQIRIEGRRVVLASEEIGDREYRTITGVVSLGMKGERMLSVLLAGERREAERRTQEVYDALLLTTAAIIVFMSGLAWVMARRIAAPILKLSDATARIAMGDLSAEVTAAARDETGDLVASFNAMARALRKQRDDLEQRGNYIEKILLNATTGVLSVDLRGRVVTINPAAVAILGIPDLRTGQDLLALMSGSPECEPLARALRAYLDSGMIPQRIEAEIGPPGQSRHARVRIVPFAEGAGLLLFLDDVTETVRSQRLAAWAEMARRIAHEIKNPLTPIQLSADHLKRVYADGSPGFKNVLDECLRTIHEQVQTLRKIAGEFSDYARVPEIRKEPTRMREFLEEVVRPYRVAPPGGVSVECDLDGTLPTLDVDRTLMSQALVNLIENALQAMPDGGKLTISAGMLESDGQRDLQIAVADTGVGMDREALSRAFEPYFSTKGTGTGLGMAIARRAIEEHRGRIDLTSAPKRGTTARIILPLP